MSKPMKVEEAIPGEGTLNNVKTMVTNALDDGMQAARRFAKRGKYAAEEFADETAHVVKKNPFTAVAVTFGVGVGVGAFTMWWLRRKVKN